MRTARCLFPAVALLLLLPAAGPAQDKPAAKYDKLRLEADALCQEEKYAEAIEHYKAALAVPRLLADDKIPAHVQLAASYALTGDKKKALSSLKEAVKCGFDDMASLTGEAAFESLKEEKDFVDLVKKTAPALDDKEVAVKIEKKGDVANDPAANAWPGAAEFLSDHYRVQIDLPEEEATRVVQKMEYLLKTMRRMFKLDLSKWKDRKLCYLFKDLERFQKVRDKLNVAPRAVHGWAGADALYCFVLGRGYGGLYWTYLHETAHMVMYAALNPTNAVNPEAPFWSVEGTACFMASIRMQDDNSVAFGREDHATLREIFAQNGGQLSAMVLLDQQTFYSTPGQGKLYMMGYGLDHYFFNAERGRYKKRFLEYVKAAHLPKGKADLEKAVGLTPAEIQERLMTYIKELK